MHFDRRKVRINREGIDANVEQHLAGNEIVDNVAPG